VPITGQLTNCTPAPHPFPTRLLATPRSCYCGGEMLAVSRTVVNTSVNLTRHTWIGIGPCTRQILRSFDVCRSYRSTNRPWKSNVLILTLFTMLLGYNKKQVSSFNQFFGFEFRFWKKKIEFNITILNNNNNNSHQQSYTNATSYCQLTYHITIYVGMVVLSSFTMHGSLSTIVMTYLTHVFILVHIMDFCTW